MWEWKSEIYIIFQGVSTGAIINKVVDLCKSCHKEFPEGKFAIPASWVKTKIKYWIPHEISEWRNVFLKNAFAHR